MFRLVLYYHGRDLVTNLNVCICYMYICFTYECEYVQKSLFTYRLSQLIGHLLLLFWFPPVPILCISVITVKQAFGNHRLLAGYGTKPIGAGLGRDTSGLSNFSCS